MEVNYTTELGNMLTTTLSPQCMNTHTHTHTHTHHTQRELDEMRSQTIMNTQANIQIYFLNKLDKKSEDHQYFSTVPKIKSFLF